MRLGASPRLTAPARPRGRRGSRRRGATRFAERAAAEKEHDRGEPGEDKGADESDDACGWVEGEAHGVGIGMGLRWLDVGRNEKRRGLPRLFSGSGSNADYAQVTLFL